MNITFLYLFLVLKNTALLKKECVVIKYNPFFLPFLESFYKEGLLLSYKILYKNTSAVGIKIYLRFLYNKFNLSNLKLISTPSNKKYLKYKDICKFFSIKSILFLSTTRGILTNLECQKQLIGGKLYYIC
jgi:ribosomal protein S8